MIGAQTSLVDVAFAVCTSLDAVGTRAVLVGGSAATFYVPDAYVSGDADFVIQLSPDARAAAAAMRELGYELRGSIYFHGQNPYTVEFPPGPLAIGEDRAIVPVTVRRGEQLLHVLSPTDVVRDRLLWYLAYGDPNGLRVATDVASRVTVHDQVVRSWVESEAGLGSERLRRMETFFERVRRAR